MSDFPVSKRASRIEYAIRDVVVPADELEAQGHTILKMNIGDPIAYPGLPTPEHMVTAFQESLGRGETGYSASYGLPLLRQAIANDESAKGWPCQPDDVYVCHGVTEALQIIFAATLESGDQVLAPGPHYPPYMAYPQMHGATTIEYRLDSEDGWRLDFDDIESKMNEHVRLLVIINPNNPTGNVADAGDVDRLIEIASNWPNCLIIADEIYDGIDYTGQHASVANRSEIRAKTKNGVPVLTLNGVSKVFYAPGWRIGYFALFDPTGRTAGLRDGLERLLRSRLCASAPAQMGYLAGLEGGKEWMKGYNERLLKQRNRCIERIENIEGLEVQTPGGAFYMFVKLTDEKWANNDKKFVLDLLHEEHVLCVHGSGFSPALGRGHFRLVFLPEVDVLDDAFDRIERFLLRHRHNS